MGKSASHISVTLPRLAKGEIALIDREVVTRPRTRIERQPDLAPEPRRKPVSRWLAVLPFVILLPLFYLFAWQNGEKNNAGMSKKGYPVIFDHDQHSYLNMGKMMRLAGYQRVTPRHRMPGYAFLLSGLYLESDAYDKSDDADRRNISPGYFLRAKHFNILLSVLCIVALYFVSRRFLPPLESHVVVWAFAWLLAVFRAPYVQPEVTFYALLLIGLVMLWRLLVNPRWWLAGASALVLAGAFLLKSTVIPLIALFLGVSVVRLAVRIFEARQGGGAIPWPALAKGLGTALAVPAVFGAVLFPFFRNTAEMYGSPLWDVHSRHYMWMESDEEKRFWRKAGISEPDFVAPEGKAVPTLETYLASHDAGQMVRRVHEGWGHTRNMIRDRYTALDFLVRRLAPFALLFLVVAFWRRSRRVIGQHWVEGLLVAGFFLGYSLLYSWYEAIGVGPRLALALFLPALFFLVLAIHRLAEPVILKVYRWQAPLRVVLGVIMLAFVAFGAIGVVTQDLWVVEGGR